MAKSPGTGPSGGTELLLGATGVNASIGGSGTQLTVSNAGFGLIVEADHSYALQASGQGALTGISGVTLSGLLGVQRNTTSGPVNRQIQVGSGAYAISVPAGPSFSQFGGQGIAIGLLGQQLTGDLTVTSTATGVSISLANVSASLGGGLATVSGGQRHADGRLVRRHAGQLQRHRADPLGARHHRLGRGQRLDRAAGLGHRRPLHHDGHGQRRRRRC